MGDSYWGIVDAMGKNLQVGEYFALGYFPLAFYSCMHIEYRCLNSHLAYDPGWCVVARGETHVHLHMYPSHTTPADPSPHHERGGVRVVLRVNRGEKASDFFLR